MKNYTLTLLSLIIATISFSQRGIGTNTPDASAALDVSSVNKGVLIPRIALLGNNDVTTVPTPQTSLIVYNTATVVGANAVVPGFYYYNGTIWTPLVNGAQGLNDSDWIKSGTISTIPQSINDSVYTFGNVGVDTRYPITDFQINDTTYRTFHISEVGGASAPYGFYQSINGVMKPGNPRKVVKYAGTSSNGFAMSSYDHYGNISFANAPGTANVHQEYLWDTTVSMTITNTNRVGIGTTAPTEKLEVVGIINAGDSTSTKGATILTGRYSNGALTTLGSHYSDGGPVIGYGVEPTSLANGYESSTGIIGLDRSALHLDEDIEFLSAPVSTTPIGTVIPMTSNMIIKNNGNVGIGTTNPNSALHIKSSFGAPIILQNNAQPKESNVMNNYISFRDSNNTEYGYVGDGSSSSKKIHVVGHYDYAIELASYDNLVARRGGIIINENGAASIKFDTKNSERAIIDSIGNMGIGTTAPSAKLDVNGRVHFAGNKGMLSYYNVGIYDQAEFSALGATTSLSLVTNSVSRLNIIPTGQVGIGTTTPTHWLDVVGQTRIRSITDTTATLNVLVANANGVIKKIHIDSVKSSGGGGGSSLWVQNGNGTGIQTSTSTAAGRPGASGANALAGGIANTASGGQSVIVGGTFNVASGTPSFVGAGTTDTASGVHSAVVGGLDNKAGATYAFVGGGFQNKATTISSTVSGGQQNEATGLTSTISGGQNNEAPADFSTVSGGLDNDANGIYSVIAGGRDNAILTTGGLGGYSTVSGGRWNVANGARSTISGGERMEAPSFGEWVGGTFGTNYTPASATVHTASDRMFAVGNGTWTGDRDDGLIVQKNGNVFVGTDFSGSNGAGTRFTSGEHVLLISEGVAPGSLIGSNKAAIWNDAGEIRVVDEANNSTVISPHNFSLIPGGASESLAWSFFSERDGEAINVDMAKMARIVEDLSGENLVYLKNKNTGELQLKDIDESKTIKSLILKVEEQKNESEAQIKKLEVLEKENAQMKKEIEEIKALLLKK